MLFQVSLIWAKLICCTFKIKDKSLYQNIKKILCLVICFVLTLGAYAQDSSSEEISINEELNQVLGSLYSLKHTLRTDRKKRPISRKIRLITRKIIRAVNSTPPENCLQQLKMAMNDFYDLVSELELGITCGPAVLPPFLPGEDELIFREDLAIDCIPPEFDDTLGRFQIGGPFGGSFADVNPVYDQCRDLFQQDNDSNDISDVCE